MFGIITITISFYRKRRRGRKNNDNKPLLLLQKQGERFKTEQKLEGRGTIISCCSVCDLKNCFPRFALKTKRKGGNIELQKGEIGTIITAGLHLHLKTLTDYVQRKKRHNIGHRILLCLVKR